MGRLVVSHRVLFVIGSGIAVNSLPDYELVANTAREFGVFLCKDAEMTACLIARTGATED